MIGMTECFPNNDKQEKDTFSFIIGNILHQKHGSRHIFSLKDFRQKKIKYTF